MAMVPTLGNNSFLTNPEDIMAYTIQVYASVPKNATVTHYSHSISLTDTISTFGNNKDTIIEPIKMELTREFNRIFETGTTTVDVVCESITEVTYAIILDISVLYEDVLYKLTRRIHVDDNGILRIPDGAYTP